MKDTLAVILGGGKGTRLYPLTKYRSKPAVPLAGKYRLIDIPVSNCLNSDISRIFVLTQYNSASLNRHISLTYNFDAFRHEGFVNILAAEQTQMSRDWFQGTADAVRKTLRHYKPYRFKQYLILSGDHIYSMDYRKLIREHRAMGAEVTVAALPVDRDRVSALGTLQIDRHGMIKRFVEKPNDPKVIDSLEIGPEFWRLRGEEPKRGFYLANMGVYVFNRNVLEDMLISNDDLDFGKEIFPRAIADHRRVYGSLFDGYWEDIGTIRSYFESNLAFLDIVPKFSFYDESFPVFTHPRFLPPSKITNARTERSSLSEGCIVDDATIINSIIGLRSIVGAHTTIINTFMMGADYYESEAERLSNATHNLPHVGVGRGSHIERAIIDKNARIGEGVRIIGGEQQDQEGEGWMLRDGIVVIEKDAVISDGTQLVFK